ncbi:hypothetical protein DUNSADRAFT_6784 [Dunaliella salina]|uniref:Encoded protein n=1 Tax=Dunaliella salina TaxID=3046 RepID=A0ABQ7GML9_DUNSA|nr:hypothetical protein DUNSADRAFT_6784 [Dunaliella salina]|eukprot:KAF5835851.1 hypothetical protein DUNSADRAFT_6784 [Dunaliella salina]
MQSQASTPRTNTTWSKRSAPRHSHPVQKPHYADESQNELMLIEKTRDPLAIRQTPPLTMTMILCDDAKAAKESARLLSPPPFFLLLCCNRSQHTLFHSQLPMNDKILNVVYTYFTSTILKLVVVL